jgi:ThiF family
VKPWPERHGELYQAERSHWADRGFTEGTTPAGSVTFEGDISIRVKPADGPKIDRTFRVRVIYPPGYPHDAPDVEFVNPKIKYSRHMAAGEPCLYPPRAWDGNVPASEIERKIESWLRGYVTGSWPRELPLYELPAYYAYARPTIFITDKVLPSMDGRDAGRFSVTEFQGYDLAVVRTVDQEPLGDDLIEGLGLPKSAIRKPHNGRWFRLTEEPTPIKNTAELASVLAASGHRFSDKDRPEPTQLIGLVFEDEHLGQTQLLMLDYGVSSKKATRPIHTRWKVRAPRVHVVSRLELFKRVEAVNDLETLDPKRVTVFGLGAIGSHATLALVREGVGELTLCDPDRLTPGNVVRHALDLLSVGQLKAYALSDAVYRANPFALAEPVVEGLSDPRSVEQHFAAASLVLGMIGDDPKEAMLTEIAVTGEHQVPVLIARTLHAGAAIRLILVRPGRDACMECLRLHRDDRHPDWIEVPDDDLPDVYDEGCATASRPGAGLASQEAALLAVKRVMAIFNGWNGDENQWLFVNQPIAGATDQRVAAEGIHTVRLPPHPRCRWCSAP